MRVFHYDRIDLRLDSNSLRMRGDALEVEGVGARVGLYTYHDDQGRPFVELVPPDTLFDAKSLATVPGADVTIRHPAGLVTSDNWRDTSHGTWLSAWPEGDQLGVRLLVKSAEGQAMIRDAAERGQPVELSPGYEVDVVAEPGQTEHGRHDAVQRGRVYNHIALLGPGEARGGPQMRLALDGPVCAPEGCRVQLARVTRADGRERTHMQVKVTHKDGRTVTADAGLARWLVDASKSVKIDQIETTMVTVTKEGEEPIELTLPSAMVEAMLEGIGAGAAAAPAAPEGMEEAEMVEQAEGLDADDEERGDSITSAVRREVAKALKRRDAVAKRRDAVTKRREHADARFAEVARHAATLNTDAAGDWHTIACDAICKARPDLEADTRLLARRAQSDAVAEGMLRERLAQVAAAAGGQPSTMAKGDSLNYDNHHNTKTDNRGPWERGESNKKELH